ncbi:MAG: hypothetical protein ACLKAK_04255 [Alkaliphilus sp.]
MSKLLQGFNQERQLAFGKKEGRRAHNINEEFKDYLFKVHLFAYIKKTIQFTAMQIKNKSSKIEFFEEKSLNSAWDKYGEEHCFEENEKKIRK